ncbi:hypothetical protein [Nocardia iowensis]|uniref:Uncharacterized protein n=1 Tax=Nocardia iowensis TaxID=204891 RepID=A0ABX8RJU9_NOCIO|nr:hypothetical protein [Nocardia iowensis]QXN88695.1 hypothetical protein KV110_24230 [Nocardia iowensis]
MDSLPKLARTGITVAAIALASSVVIAPPVAAGQDPCTAASLPIIAEKRSNAAKDPVCRDMEPPPVITAVDQFARHPPLPDCLKHRPPNDPLEDFENERPEHIEEEEERDDKFNQTQPTQPRSSGPGR